MKLKNKILYALILVLSLVILMPSLDAKTTAYYKKKNGTCASYPDLPGFCYQPGVDFYRTASYSSCDLGLSCFEAAAAYYGTINSDNSGYWQAQSVLNGKTYYSNSSCTNAISTAAAENYAVDYCTLPDFGGTVVNMYVGSTYELKDNNSTLVNYKIVYTSSAFTVTQNGNNIRIKALSEINGAEILMYRGSKNAISGHCSNSSQDYVTVNGAPYVSKKIKVNITRRPEEPSSTEEPSSEEPSSEEPYVPQVRYGGLRIIKTDTDGNPIPNAVFKLGVNLNKTEGIDYVVRTTDENGYISYNGIVVGSSFYYQEIETPDGYILDNKIHYIYIGDEKVFDARLVNFREEEGSIKIVKVNDDGEKLQGVRFAVGKNLQGTLNTDYKIYTTDELGEINIYDLEDGEYQAKEIETLDGYYFNASEAYTYSLVINEEQKNATLTVVNRKQVNTLLTIIKKDKQTDNVLPNAKINIYNADGSLYKEATTDENGKIVVEDIELGGYFLEEVEAPNGYRKSDDRPNFEITDQNPVVTLTVYNEIINSKTGELNLIIPIVIVLTLGAGTYIVLKKRQKIM